MLGGRNSEAYHLMLRKVGYNYLRLRIGAMPGFKFARRAPTDVLVLKQPERHVNNDRLTITWWLVGAYIALLLATNLITAFALMRAQRSTDEASRK
jgi:hypothetical protein